MRRLWIAGWTAVVILLVVGVTSLFAAILLQNNADGGVDEPLGGLAIASLIMGGLSLWAMAVWTGEAQPHQQRRLPREMRRELKAREAQMLFDGLIRQMERENGILHD